MTSNAPLWHEICARAEETLRSTEFAEGAPRSDVESVLLAVSRIAADEWRGHADRVLGSAEEGRGSFTRALRAKWGPALDLLLLFIEGAEQFGDGFVTSQSRDNRTPLTETLLTLHAAACVCAHEIRWLLSGGYPAGAESRSRTLHEIGVTALVLADHAEDDAGLLQRYIDHRVVADWRYWSYIAEHYSVIGVKEPEAGMISRLDARVAELVAQHSKAFVTDYGWAVPLVGKGTLTELEVLAGRDDRRPLYKVASSDAVHANSNLLRRHYVQRADGPERLSNATIQGLARPAAVASHWLWDSTSGLVGAAQRSESYTPVIGLMALRLLRDDLTQALGDVDDSDC